MANKRFLLAILVLALVFGMTVTGCSDDDSDNTSGNNTPGSNTSVTNLDGTYINQSNTSSSIVIQGNSWTFSEATYGATYKGTFTISGNNMSGKSTHGLDEVDGWYSYTGFTFSATVANGGKSFTITSGSNNYGLLGTYLRQ